MPVILAGLLGSFLAGSCTAIGALPILLRTHLSQRGQSILLAAAAGVMLGATVFSLLIPAMEIVTERSGSETEGALVGAGGLLLGALAIWIVHRTVPHEHFMKGPESNAPIRLGRHWLFVLAITLHNFPEGMSVGVAYGGELSAGVAVSVGIGLQNLPEGLAVAAALIDGGFARGRAFWTAALTGLVEPFGGLLGVALVSVSDVVLPWGLSFAAGAMLFVISGEVIPESHRAGVERQATFSLVLGFIVMMLLDVTLG